MTVRLRSVAAAEARTGSAPSARSSTSAGMPRRTRTIAAVSRAAWWLSSPSASLAAVRLRRAHVASCLHEAGPETTSRVSGSIPPATESFPLLAEAHTRTASAPAACARQLEENSSEETRLTSGPITPASPSRRRFVSSAVRAALATVAADSSATALSLSATAVATRRTNDRAARAVASAILFHWFPDERFRSAAAANRSDSRDLAVSVSRSSASSPPACVISVLFAELRARTQSPFADAALTLLEVKSSSSAPTKTSIPPISAMHVLFTSLCAATSVSARIAAFLPPPRFPSLPLVATESSASIPPSTRTASRCFGSSAHNAQIAVAAIAQPLSSWLVFRYRM
mmetsp:Transcript_8355/g.25937  ORF Transcript_8355/g.25937 Transcript_8355/m.25937 type:complete len:344 (-) Transcript_8355:63-1094(-)